MMVMVFLRTLQLLSYLLYGCAIGERHHMTVKEVYEFTARNVAEQFAQLRPSKIKHLNSLWGFDYHSSYFHFVLQLWGGPLTGVVVR